MATVPSVQKHGYNAKSTDPNPFKMPDDKDIFQFRKTEEAQRKLEDGLQQQKKKLGTTAILRESEPEKEFQRELSLPVHEKKTYSFKLKARQLELRKKLREGLGEDDETTNQTQIAVQLFQKTPACNFIMFKGRNIEKEGIHEFINKKREMFYLEYALTVKREEIEQLEKVASCEEKKLAKAEKLLEEDTVLFDEFLKENDKKSAEAIKIAEQETKAKMEKIAKIKRVTAKMVAIKSEISKYKDTLREYKLYKDFLFKLSPPEWQVKQKEKTRSYANLASAINKAECDGKRKQERGKKHPQSDKGMNREKRSSAGSRELPPLRDVRVSSRHSVKSTPESGKISPESDVDSSDYEEEPELYFTDPQQLLDLLSELEEQNLSLIQNSQDAEEELEKFRKNMELTRKNMEDEANQLNHLSDIMRENIDREKERTAELQLKARLFNFGKYKTEEESILNALSKKVDEVYRSCIGDSEANLSPLQMLAAIENRLGELLDNMEMIPADRLAMAEKAKEKERRIRLREEKLQLQKQHQEERMKKAMERAQAEIKRMPGKKLMPRSQLSVRKLKDNQDSEITDKEKEEYNYFFT